MGNEGNGIMMKAPDKIYLQIGDDVLPEEFDELNTEGITWSAVKIDENDLQFISAEKVKELKDKYEHLVRQSQGFLQAVAGTKLQTGAKKMLHVYQHILTDLTALIEGE